MLKPDRDRFRSAAVCAVLLCGLIASKDAAADDLIVTAGAKLWLAQWTSWDTVPSRSSLTGAPITVVEPVSENNRLAVIPQASLRYGNWLGTASYFAKTSFDLNGAVDPQSGKSLPISASRWEFDANAGYYVLPSVAITVGYKQIEQTFGPSSREPEVFKWRGPTLALAASSVLTQHIAMYGTVGVGYLRLNVEQDLHDAANRTGFDAIYALGEAGLSYSVATPYRVSLTTTLGYRVQIVTTENYALSNGFSNGRTDVDVHDTTQGPAFTVVGRF